MPASPTRGRTVLLLDALGTLVALQPPGPLLRAELQRRFGIEVGEDQAADAIAAEIAYYRTHFDEGADGAGLASLRERCAEVVRGALPPSPALERISPPALTEALLASIRFSAFADARPALAVARGRGMRTIVASNWDVSLHEVLQRLGLGELLDGIVTSAEVGARKPAAAVFERALALAEAQPSQAIHVGDSLDEDVAGAQALGIEAVLLSRDGGAAPPLSRPGGAAPPGVQVIGGLRELERVLSTTPRGLNLGPDA
jgi:putative hydrolase of the HAD superfamily